MITIVQIEAKEENETLQSKPDESETARETVDVTCRCTLEDSNDDDEETM